MTVQICIGSSCHIKGAPIIVERLQKAISDHGLEADIDLVGSFCIGKCNRTGVTVQVNDDIHVGVTKEGFKDFFQTYILDAIANERS